MEPCFERILMETPAQDRYVHWSYRISYRDSYVSPMLTEVVGNKCACLYSYCMPHTGKTISFYIENIIENMLLRIFEFINDSLLEFVQFTYYNNDIWQVISPGAANGLRFMSENEVHPVNRRQQWCWNWFLLYMRLIEMILTVKFSDHWRKKAFVIRHSKITASNST